MATGQPPADPKGLYAALEVPATATPEEIKKAYRKKALVLHPDKNPDDPEATKRFQEVGNAYAVLSDAQKRERYDTTGQAGDDDDDMEDMDMDLLMQMFMGAFDGMMMDEMMFMNGGRPGSAKKSKGRSGKFGKGRATGPRSRPRGGPGMDMPPGMAAMFAGMPMGMDEELDEMDEMEEQMMFELLMGGGMPGMPGMGGPPGSGKKKKGKKGGPSDEPTEEEIAMLLEMMGGGMGPMGGMDDEMELDAGMAEMLFGLGGPGMGPGMPGGPAPAQKRGGTRKKARGRR